MARLPPILKLLGCIFVTTLRPSRGQTILPTVQQWPSESGFPLPRLLQEIVLH